MSEAEDIHIVRVDGQRDRRAPPEVLCGYVTPRGGNRVSGPPDMATCWKCILLQCGRPVPVDPPVPEHERLHAAKKTDDATQLVGRFIDWLSDEKSLVLAERSGDGELHNAIVITNNLLAEFFGVNRGALEAEKQALLDHLRATNEARQWAMTEGKKALADQINRFHRIEDEE